VFSVRNNPGFSMTASSSENPQHNGNRGVPAQNNFAAPGASQIGSVSLRYLKQTRILVQGPITGRHYEFSGARPCQSVDARDVEALLRTRFLSRQ